MTRDDFVNTPPACGSAWRPQRPPPCPDRSPGLLPARISNGDVAVVGAGMQLGSMPMRIQCSACALMEPETVRCWQRAGSRAFGLKFLTNTHAANFCETYMFRITAMSAVPGCALATLR